MDREFNLSLLRTFVTVATTRSFTATGRHLFRTQPAISQRIRRLESLVGFPLMTRSADGVSLTREGAVLLGYARRLLTLNDEAMQRLRADRAPQVIRLGLPEECPYIGLDQVLERLAAEHFNLTVTIEVRLNAEIASGFAKGAYDIVLRHGPIDGTGTPARRGPLVWVADSRRRSPFGPVLPLVMFPEGSVYRELALEALMQAAVPWRIVCTATSAASLCSAVRAGLGVSAMAGEMVGEGMGICGIEDGLPPLPEAGISVEWRHGAASPEIQHLVELFAAGLP